MCLRDYRHVGCTHFKSVRRVLHEATRQANTGYVKADRKREGESATGFSAQNGKKSKVLMRKSGSVSCVAKAWW